MMRVAWVGLVLGGCFNPTFTDPTCGPHFECPPGLTCYVGGVCRASAVDAKEQHIDAASADAVGDAAGPFAGCQNDTDLVACYRFESAPPPLDGSSYGNDATTFSGAIFPS